MRPLEVLCTALLSALLSTFLVCAEQLPIHSPKRSRPNFVFILTDDQDVQMNSLDYMHHLQRHLVAEGTVYRKHFCTVAICCPSRVNIWTGRAAHNTNVTDINPPYGGFPKFVAQGLNDNFLPVWLQEAGYATYYTGKLFNAHTVDNYNSPFVRGFNGSDFLLDPYTYQYLNSTYQRNRDAPVSHEGEYTTDVLALKAYGFLNDALAQQDPFFLAIAPIAPHSNVIWGDDNGKLTIPPAWSSSPISAERHRDLFKDVKIPRRSNFNPEKPSGVNWISKLPRRNDTVIAYNDHFYRQRLRALQAVDEIIDGVIQRLEAAGVLDNTYIIYTSDNGYHIGQHRLNPGKECGYEEDINVPLIIRGPNVPRGEETSIVSSHTDIVPTIFSLAGIQQKNYFDGAAIPTSSKELAVAKHDRHEHVNVEFWGIGITEGLYGMHRNFDEGSDEIGLNNTYKAVRLVGKDYSVYYSVWCNNEHELHDLISDPGQVNNLLGKEKSEGPTLLGLPIAKVAARLDSLLLVLKSCKAETCINPWKVLHPAGNVNSLKDALSLKYDQFYEVDQHKVSFSRCEFGYIIDAEGPQEALIYRNGLRWSEWT